MPFRIFFYSKRKLSLKNVIMSYIFIKVALCKILNTNFNSAVEEKNELTVN